MTRRWTWTSTLTRPSTRTPLRQPRERTANDEWVWGCDSKEGGGGSGGYLEHVFRYAAAKLFGIEVRGALEYKIPRARNLDLREVTLAGTRRDDAAAFRAGMRFPEHPEHGPEDQTDRARHPPRHIQRRVRVRCVEIMACPERRLPRRRVQLPPPPPPEEIAGIGGARPQAMTAKELVDELETKYRWGDGTVEPRPPDASPEVAEAYRDWVRGGGGFGESARAVSHAVPRQGRGGCGGGGGGAVAAAAQLKLTSDW